MDAHTVISWAGSAEVPAFGVREAGIKIIRPSFWVKPGMMGIRFIRTVKDSTPVLILFLLNID